MEELQRGGFAGAISACASRAQELTRAYAERTGLDVRRVSRKARNTQNVPDTHETAVLEEWELAARRGETLRESAVVRTENGARVLRYMKPIVVESMCLSCHGSKAQINGKVRAGIQRHYPNDPATGYREGELRGAFTVRLPLQP